MREREREREREKEERETGEKKDKEWPKAAELKKTNKKNTEMLPKMNNKTWLRVRAEQTE